LLDDFLAVALALERDAEEDDPARGAGEDRPELVRRRDGWRAVVPAEEDGWDIGLDGHAPRGGQARRWSRGRALTGWL
jgi:hypothetical protein